MEILPDFKFRPKIELKIKMENFKHILEQQKEALTRDIDAIIEQVQTAELQLEKLKDLKSKAQSALRAIEKKLAKL